MTYGSLDKVVSMLYRFGMTMYQYTGATYSLMIGVVLVMIQWFFCRWWLQTHKQGPLESIWHEWTWMKI